MVGFYAPEGPKNKEIEPREKAFNLEFGPKESDLGQEMYWA